MTANGTYDYVIVGGGSAGCVLANRLSADDRVSVALLEAGPSDWLPFIHVPAGYIALMMTGIVDWGFHTEPQAGLNGRSLFWPRGRVLGGSSSVNAAIYMRGVPSDYDTWAQLGNRGWSWDDVRSYFVKSERYEGDSVSELRGREGHLRVARPNKAHVLSKAWIDAGQQAGFPATDDFNGVQQEGFGLLECTVAGGRRQSAAVSYLNPARSRKNLTVITGAQATRILFQGSRAVGIEYARKRRRHEIRCTKEVIVSGGAINSPHLLMLSGVGPADEIAPHGIRVLHELPGVGKNLQDHLRGEVKYASTKPITILSDLLPVGAAKGLASYLYSKTGPLSQVGCDALAFLKTREGALDPELQYHFAPLLYADHGRKVSWRQHGFMAYFNMSRPESRGTISLKSADPLAHPAIQPNYLTAREDVRLLRDGLRIARDVIAQSAFDEYRGTELAPGPHVQSDYEIDAFHRATAETIYHPVGTCKMGQDDLAVVDERLRVRGLDGLRVVDASVMPRLVSGNTNAPTMMIAEKAADMILAA